MATYTTDTGASMDPELWKRHGFPKRPEVEGEMPEVVSTNLTPAERQEWCDFPEKQGELRARALARGFTATRTDKPSLNTGDPWRWIPYPQKGWYCPHGCYDPRGEAACWSGYCASGNHVNFDESGRWRRVHNPHYVAPVKKPRFHRRHPIVAGLLLIFPGTLIAGAIGVMAPGAGVVTAFAAFLYGLGLIASRGKGIKWYHILIGLIGAVFALSFFVGYILPLIAH